MSILRTVRNRLFIVRDQEVPSSNLGAPTILPDDLLPNGSFAVLTNRARGTFAQRASSFLNSSATLSQAFRFS